jgi:hypothetical protein
MTRYHAARATTLLALVSLCILFTGCCCLHPCKPIESEAFSLMPVEKQLACLEKYVSRTKDIPQRGLTLAAIHKAHQTVKRVNDSPKDIHAALQELVSSLQELSGKRDSCGCHAKYEKESAACPSGDLDCANNAMCHYTKCVVLCR